MNKLHKRLVLIGNGFDLAHKIPTSYYDFLKWYLSNALEHVVNHTIYEDKLITLKSKGYRISMPKNISELSVDEILNVIRESNLELNYKNFKLIKYLIEDFKTKGWVDIEMKYYSLLKKVFNSNLFDDQKKIQVVNLNFEFNFLTKKLIEYLKMVNEKIDNMQFSLEPIKHSLSSLFSLNDDVEKVYLNFNYTDTLFLKKYALDSDCIFIHGRISNQENNPIIFGYGDESDPDYQKMEDSGENAYLEHIKSFGYFKSESYKKLVSFIDSNQFKVSIIGHSCGLSDRILLREIFEHTNCEDIDIYYHKNENGFDNFKLITQEISRHFRPENKIIMRRKIINKSNKNIIPQLH